MDTTTRERDIVKQVIQRYAQFKPSHGDIRLDTVSGLRHFLAPKGAKNPSEQGK